MSVRIKDLPLLDLDDIYGYLKIPTGGDGNFAITLDNIRDWVAKKHSFALKTELEDHIKNKNNPHNVTKNQVGLGNVDNTSDMDKPVSYDQNIINNKIEERLRNHLYSIDNPHEVTKNQVGLGNVDNTSDIDKPISNAQNIVNNSLNNEITNHIGDNNNPHNVNKQQVGLGNVDNTSDLDKPISILQDAINKTIVKSVNSITPNDVSGDVSIPIFGATDGLVPKRVGTTSNKFLREDGTWITPTNTAYAVISTAEVEQGTAKVSRVITAERLKETVKFHSKNMIGLPVFENNTEALGAGLLDGDIYKTSTGQLMVTYI